MCVCACVCVCVCVTVFGHSLPGIIQGQYIIIREFTVYSHSMTFIAVFYSIIIIFEATTKVNSNDISIFIIIRDHHGLAY